MAACSSLASIKKLMFVGCIVVSTVEGLALRRPMLLQTKHETLLLSVATCWELIRLATGTEPCVSLRIALALRSGIAEDD